MSCKERILSNDYADIIIDFALPERFNYQIPVDYCMHEVLGDLSILYLKRDEIPGIRISDASYYFIPRCYGLTQQDGTGGRQDYNSIALTEAGILAVQRSPLNLTGRDVIIGFVDTGE